ncbi:hypothetical protein AB0L06_34440 [Spirillospora sp. NPDC052269]
MADEAPSKRTLSALGRYTTVTRQVLDGQDLTSLCALNLWFDRCSFVTTDLRHATLDGCSFNLRPARSKSAGCVAEGRELGRM